MKNNSTYYPALDGLRFFAFLLVFLHHSAFYINEDLSNNVFWDFFRNNGWVGVDIFFVLTGFLITILLLEEKKLNGHFSIRNFLIKRVLRIWPLYYLAILSGYFFAPFFFENIFKLNYLNFNYWQQVQNNLPWYSIFLGNWNIVFNGFGDLRSISQLWAISVDQQFYIFWPIVLLFSINLKRSLFIGILLIIFAILTRIFLININVQHPVIYTNTFARIDTFVFGALLAQICFFNPKLLTKFNLIFSSFFQIIIIFTLILFLYFSSIENRLSIRNGVWGYLIIDLIITYLIYCCIRTSSFFIKLLDQKGVRYLGKISYGLYIWHILALEILFYTVNSENLNLFIPILGLPLTILFAYISYNYFEKPFLKLKSNLR